MFTDLKKHPKKSAPTDQCGAQLYLLIPIQVNLTITRQAKLLGMSRGSVYYLPRPVSEADLELMRKIDRLHLEHPFMGTRMLRDQLVHAGIQVGRRHIGTLMRHMGIESLAPQPGTTKRAPGHKIYPYLLRNVPITRAGESGAAARQDRAACARE